MTESSNPSRIIAGLIISELDHFTKYFQPEGGPRVIPGQNQLVHEPFVGYASVTDRKGVETKLLICRHETPLNFKAQNKAVDFASYLSPLGRIITKRPGEEHKFQVKTRNGFVLEDHQFQLLEKDDFRPQIENGNWDAVNNQMAWIDGRLSARSLRRLLEGETEQRQDREVRYSVQLPDQAILDSAQDEIFRLPLQTRLRISGAPGTGKTTVLLKRLSQKTKREFLADAELKGIRDEDWREGRNWMLFTPSDLLKIYLKEAMANELLPASDEHVKVYRTFRLEILRDIGFIRVGQRGYFKAAPDGRQLLKRATGEEQVALAKAFGSFLANRYSLAARESLQKFNNDSRQALGKLSDIAQKILSMALDILSKPLTDLIALQQAQQRAAGYRKLNEDLTRLIKSVRGVTTLFDDSTNLSLARIYRQTRTLSAALESLSPAGMDIALFPEIPPLIVNLRNDLGNLNEAFTLNRLFQILPRSYQDFRESSEYKARFFLDGTTQSINERTLSESEQDVILFHALQFVRELADELPSAQTAIPGEIRVLLNHTRLMVCVDEAADFSPLELACMERFCKVGSGGITICGDLMQRVTQQGLKSWDDILELSEAYEGRELLTSYRQTERLFAIAKDLYRHSQSVEPGFSSAYPKRQEDPPPLLHKSTNEHPVESWLTAQICEIYELCNQHLPTTAILVASREDVEPLKQKLKPILRENGLEVEASHEGQALGDSARVRIFPVEFIKGLEFEAVFYVGLDRMADLHKDLIDKYVYVGLSRARSFLGVNIERQFPQRLKCIADHFSQNGSWLSNPQS